MKIIIITGTSQGLGKALFKYYDREGVVLYCLARRFLQEQRIAEKIKRAYLIKKDLTDLENDFLDELVMMLKKNINKNDEVIFFNNAGAIEPIGKIGSIENKKLKESIQVNFMAPILLVNSLVRIFTKENIKMKIVNVTSGAANYPIEGWSGYCSAKAAVKMFLDVLKLQYSHNKDLRIYNIDPGVMNTNMQEKIRTASQDEFPNLKSFHDLYHRNQLKNPKDVVEEIIKVLNVE